MKGLVLASDNRIVAHGEWFPALSGNATVSSLINEFGQMKVFGPDKRMLTSCSLSDMRISPRVGTIARSVTFPDGSTFLSEDNAAIDNLVRQVTGAKGDIVHGLERFHPRLFGLVALVVLLAVGIYRYALPFLVEAAVLITPSVATELLAKGALETLDRVALAPSELSRERQDALLKSFNDVAKFSPSGSARFTLNFRKGGFVGPNAFALPDGNLVITDELIDLADGDDELILGVLAHEMGHVEYEHSLRQLYHAAGVAGLIMLIGGDIGEGAQDVLVQGSGLLALSHSRSAESAADRHSVEIMLKAGRDPIAIARFFELLEKHLGDSSETNMLSSHPGTPERRAQALEYARELGAK